ncbi:hypothetical protein J132_03599 [Termitomyces sp. J132]|nr:hypothetical protein J132_03599 [Termitomyces sp. J132]
MGVLLGTKKGLEAMTKFLCKTGTFTKTGYPRALRNKSTAEDNDNGKDKDSWWNRMERQEEEEAG